jgi:hypothetical protein
MTQSPTALISTTDDDAADMDWLGVARPLWAARRLIALGALGLGAFAAVAVFALGKIESEGLYQLIAPSLRANDLAAGIVVGAPGFSDYKIISSLVAEPARLRDYLAAKGLADDGDVAGLPGALRDPAALRQLISPVYTYTKADSKDFVENPSAKEAAGQLMGLRVIASARSGEVAQKRSKVLAEYVRDTAFVQGMTEYVRARDNEQKRAALGYENSVIRDRYRLRVANDKMRDLRAVGGRNPDARGDARTVVSLSDTTVRYLPIPTHIAAEEIRAVDISVELERAGREHDQAEYSAAYYRGLQTAIAAAKTADDILKAMPGAKQEADKGRDLSDEKYKQISNATQIEILTLQDAFYNRSRFISGPTAPERSLKMPVFALALGTLVGFAAMAGFVLLRVWLRDNRTRF